MASTFSQVSEVHDSKSGRGQRKAVETSPMRPFLLESACCMIAGAESVEVGTDDLAVYGLSATSKATTTCKESALSIISH